MNAVLGKKTSARSATWSDIRRSAYHENVASWWAYILQDISFGIVLGVDKYFAFLETIACQLLIHIMLFEVSIPNVFLSWPTAHVIIADLTRADSAVSALPPILRTHMKALEMVESVDPLSIILISRYRSAGVFVLGISRWDFLRYRPIPHANLIYL